MRIFRDAISTRAIRPAAVVLLVLCFLALFQLVPRRTEAESAPPFDACTGNICEGTLTLGEDEVRYWYTQHVSPNGMLKVRFDSGTYASTSLIQHWLYNLPEFSAVGGYANPTTGAVLLPQQDVNPMSTSYDRSDSDGCATPCLVDEVLYVDYAGMDLPSGSYSFDIIVRQGGNDASANGLTFYVDPAAPDNDDESHVWLAMGSAGLDYPCADDPDVDNDLDYYPDCADDDCQGLVMDVTSGTLCNTPEFPCNDGFDNDGDGMTDCQDQDCDGQVGDNISGFDVYCQYLNETNPNCSDLFDNDGDGLIDCEDRESVPAGEPMLMCWKRAGSGCPVSEAGFCADGEDNDEDQDWSQDWDSNPESGEDCYDYDCFNDDNCPKKEHLDAAGWDADAQCFNGGDDDLDEFFDCADDDCIGVQNPANSDQMCYDMEFSLGQRYNLCSNNFDDDGDLDTDCQDVECSGRFGSCGPCPSREDYRYYSCADGRDNDADGIDDCADPDCDGKLGDLTWATYCASDENTPDLCWDNWNNDFDVGSTGEPLTDCADPSCNGMAHPITGVLCELGRELSCSDAFDNDTDLHRDCADSDCWNGTDCALLDWTEVSCQIVPRFSAFTTFTGVRPTVTAATYEATHINTLDKVRIVGSGTYSSVTVVVGDATEPDDYYPYAANGPDCILEERGAPTADFGFIVVPGKAIQIYDMGFSDINGFDLTLTCITPGTPALVRDYPVSISVMKVGDPIPEFGDRIFETTLYEDVPPIIDGYEAEGESPPGVINVNYGQSIRIRGIARDPEWHPDPAVPDTTGICSCTINVDGYDFETGSECVTEPISAFSAYDDPERLVSGNGEDGANNIGPLSSTEAFEFNVMPVATDPLALEPYPMPGRIGEHPSPFFRPSGSQPALLDFSVTSTFTTAIGDGFQPVCEVIVRSETGAPVIGDPPAAYTITFPGTALQVINAPDPEVVETTADINVVFCNATGLTLPELPQGIYYMTVRVTDTPDGDSVESNRQVLYFCDGWPKPGDPEDFCSYADFDRDGAAEGLYTQLYSDDWKPCDNCLARFNPSQRDIDVNGIGDGDDGCEQGGRCEFDRSIPCDYPSSLEGVAGCVSDPPTGFFCCPDESDPMCCPFEPVTILSPNDGGDQPEAFLVDSGGTLTEETGVQHCITDWGICLLTGEVCFNDDECDTAGINGDGTGVCTEDSGFVCKRDKDCNDPPGAPGGFCIGANICAALIFPWLETFHGNIHSRKNLYAPEIPPATKFSATFCVSAHGLINNFTSEQCGEPEEYQNTRFDRPDRDNAYSSVLGRIDVEGIRNGIYGDVEDVSGSSDLSRSDIDRELDRAGPLEGRVFRVLGDAHIGAQEFRNVTSAVGFGNGTVLVDGGDLYLHGNMSYESGSVNRLTKLASVGFIVLPDDMGHGGNIYVDGGVDTIVGAYYSGGDGGFNSIIPPDESSEVPLTVHGLVVARRFELNRSYTSQDQGSERFVYDGRVIVNPPPGFTDLSRWLPTFLDNPAQ